MAAETARIAEEQRILSKRTSLEQRLPAPEPLVSNKDKNKSPTINNRWTPNTKLNIEEN